MNRMLIIYIRSYKLVITLFKQSYDEFESYLAKEKNEFHIRNSLRFIIQSCVVFFLISFHIFINNLSLILYDLALLSSIYISNVCRLFISTVGCEAKESLVQNNGSSFSRNMIRD